MGVVRRYIDILIIINNFPYSTCIIALFLAAATLLLCSFLNDFSFFNYYSRLAHMLNDERFCISTVYIIRMSFSASNNFIIVVIVVVPHVCVCACS